MKRGFLVMEMNRRTLHIHLCLQAAEELVNVVLRDVPIQVSQVGVKLDKSAKRDPRSTPFFIICQDLTCNLKGAHEGLGVKKHREGFIKEKQRDNQKLNHITYWTYGVLRKFSDLIS